MRCIVTLTQLVICFFAIHLFDAFSMVPFQVTFPRLKNSASLLKHVMFLPTILQLNGLAPSAIFDGSIQVVVFLGFIGFPFKYPEADTMKGEQFCVIVIFGWLE